MAMASKSNRNPDAADTSQHFQAAERRVDSARGQPNVPVLFRLQNLQRIDPARAAGRATSESAAVNDGRDGRLREGRPSDRPEAHSSAASGLNPTVSTHRPPDSSSPSNAAAPTSSPDPIATPVKKGFSNGFILLMVGVIVAFALGRNSSSPPPVDTKSVPAMADATPTAPALPSAESAAPLVPPELPKFAASVPSQTEQADDAADPSLATPDTIERDEKPTHSASLLTLETNPSPNAPSDDEALPAPSMLLASTDAATNKKDESQMPVVENTHVADQVSLDSTPPNRSDNVRSQQIEFAANEKPASPDLQPKMVATNTPDIDTSKLFEMRANHQSQMEALARVQQVRAQYATAPPDANSAAMQFVSSQANVYGPSTPPAAVPPPTGYYTSQPAASFASPPLNTTSPSTSYSQPQNYTPVGPDLSYPPSAATTPQSSQPYQPLFTNPTRDPAQGFAAPTAPQAPPAPYQGLSPSFQSP